MDFRAHLSTLTARLPTKLAVSVRGADLTLAQVSGGLDAMGQVIGPVRGKRAMAVVPDGFGAYLAHLCFFLGRGTLVPQSILAPTAYLEAIAARVRPELIVTTPPLYERHRPFFERIDCLIIEPGDPGAIPRMRWQPTQGTHAGHGPSVASDVRLILFTSGSTGVPKGVCLSEGNVLAAAAMNVSILSLDSERRSLVTVPLYDYYGLIQIYSHILAGASLGIGESVSFVAEVHKRLHTSGSTDLVAVPYGLRRLFGVEAASLGSFPGSLTRVASSSDMLSEDVLASIFAARPDLVVVNVFGLTEAGRACSREIRVGDAASRSIGRPAAGVEIRTDTPPGVPGELVIRGPNVMLGYLEEVTPANEIRFEPCPEVHTGDIGYVDVTGEVFLLGRSDHLMNLKGIKIHPADIETVALRTPGVGDARAYLNGRGPGDPVLRLDIVSNGAEDVLGAVKDKLRSELPGYSQPGEVRLVDAILRTELGSKTLRSVMG